MKIERMKYRFLKNLQVSMLIFGGLVFCQTAFAKQVLYFYSNNEVISIDYQGEKTNPTSIVFDAKCDPRWCEFDERSQELLADFGYALAKGEIYVVDDDDIFDDCTQFEPCDIPFRDGLDLNSGASPKKNKPDNSFASEVKSDVQQAIINAGVEGVIDYLTSLEENAVPKFDVIFNEHNMKPFLVCRAVKGGCDPNERVTVVNNQDGSTAFSIANFNVYEAADRELRNTIENWLFNIAKAHRCVIVETGPVGDRTASWVCFIPR